MKNYDGSWTSTARWSGIAQWRRRRTWHGLMYDLTNYAIPASTQRRTSCAATKGGLSLAGVDVTKGSRDSGPRAAGRESVGGAYVRLLDSSGEFAARVPTSATGHFRFFAADGNWTLHSCTRREESR